MILKKLTTIVLLGISVSAAAQFTTVARAYEIPFSEFRAPATPNGATSFRECADCEMLYVRVTPETRYSINGKVVRFDKFREALQLVRDRENTTVVLKHHLESDTVVSIDVPVDSPVDDE